MFALPTSALRGAKLLAFMRGAAQQEKSAHTGNRAQVTSMEGLYDATTLCVPMGYGVGNWAARSGVETGSGQGRRGV